MAEIKEIGREVKPLDLYGPEDWIDSQELQILTGMHFTGLIKKAKAGRLKHKILKENKTEKYFFLRGTDADLIKRLKKAGTVERSLIRAADRLKTKSYLEDVPATKKKKGDVLSTEKKTVGKKRGPKPGQKRKKKNAALNEVATLTPIIELKGEDTEDKYTIAQFQFLTNEAKGLKIPFGKLITLVKKLKGGGIF